MKKYRLLCLSALMSLGLLTGCDDACAPEKAAGFLVSYRATIRNDYIDWDLKYVAKQFVISVENMRKVDERYGTPICRAKIKNKGYDIDKMIDRRAKDSSYVCFTYVPRLGQYVQEYGKGCCHGSIYFYDDGTDQDYCWL